MLIVFTGNGKGKTSAALGTVLRSLGCGKKVCIIQFIKGNKETGEWKTIKNLVGADHDLPIKIHQFFNDEKLSITEKSILGNPEYKKSCEDAWKFAKETILSEKFDLIILDEICNALHYNLIDEKDVLEFISEISKKPVLRSLSEGRISEDSRPDLIFTGRNASQKLIDLADLVTEMIETKHPFQKGISAKKGIDY